MNENKINAAILGYGFSGSIFFAPFLHLHPGFELVAALERSSKKIQEDYPDIRSYDRLETLLADEQIELVVVNTPIDTHYDFARRALEAGKHVIVEKTFTNSAEEALELYQLAKTKGLELFVYQNRRYDSDFLTARKILESGKLGKVVEATISYDIHHPTLRADGNAHTEKPGSGGEFNNRGSHIIDQALVLFGLPQSVFADFAAFRERGQIEDYVEVILYYPDKRVRLKETDIACKPQDAYIFHGHSGSFHKSRSDMQEERLLSGIKPEAGQWCVDQPDHQGRLYPLQDGAETEGIVVPTENGNYYDYFEAVYRTLVDGAPSPVTGLDGYHCMLVMDAARHSVQEGRIVAIEQKTRS